jgi:LPS export ABC transporter protein LptC
MNKLFVALIGAVIVFAALLFFAGVSRRQPVVASGPAETADMTLSKVSFVQTREGEKDWELTAEEARFFEKDETAFLKKIFVKMQSTKGGPLTLSGDTGRMEAGGAAFSLRQEKSPVSMQLNNGYTIQTGSLTWSPEERMIHTEDWVEVSGLGLSIRGLGMRLSLDRSEMTVRNVHAEIY